MSNNSVSSRGQVLNLAIIVAVVCYVLAGLIFFSDAIKSWGMDLQSQNPSDSIPFGPFADFVTGVGITATDAGMAWAVGFAVIALASTAMAVLINKKAKTRRNLSKL